MSHNALVEDLPILEDQNIALLVKKLPCPCRTHMGGRVAPALQSIMHPLRPRLLSLLGDHQAVA